MVGSDVVRFCVPKYLVCCSGSLPRLQPMGECSLLKPGVLSRCQRKQQSKGEECFYVVDWLCIGCGLAVVMLHYTVCIIL